jgi:putative oxidoreductase
MELLDKLKPLGLLGLRAGLAMIFIYHGFPKLTHTHQYVRDFAQYGFPAYFVLLAGLLEAFGGALLFVGFFTRAAALLLAGEMVVALARVHLPAAGLYQLPRYQLPLILAAASFAVATTGAGMLSLDYAIFGKSGNSSRRSKSGD